MSENPRNGKLIENGLLYIQKNELDIKTAFRDFKESRAKN